MSAVCPPKPSRASTVAPCSSNSFAASTLPVRATAISAVMPSAFGESASAPASSSSFRICGVRDLGGQAHRAWRRSRSRARRRRPRRAGAEPRRRRPSYTAHCSGVLPSAFLRVDVGVLRRRRLLSAEASRSPATRSTPPFATTRRSWLSLRTQTSENGPVASPNFSSSSAGTPARSSIVTSRFASGVSCW